MNHRVELLGIAALAACSLSSPVMADEVTKWNDLYLDAVRITGGGPCQISRNGAIVHVSIYEATNSLRPTHEPYIGFLKYQSPCAPRAAVAAAAHRTLTAQYPNPVLTAMFDAALEETLDAVADGPAEDNGVALGIAAADQILNARAADGSDDVTPYVYGMEPGDHRPEFPLFAPQPHGPNWFNSDPWVIPVVQDFQPSRPLKYRRKDRLLASSRYARQYNEVKDFGERDSAVRTAEQTEIAWFWANDRDGTFKPPGHLNYAAQVVSDQFDLNLYENARLLALLNLALADGVLVAWDAKYRTGIDLWRPISGIRQGDTDSNAATAPDADWEPLLEFTPPFPAYISGHSTMGGVWGSILSDFFGTDNVTYTIGTDEPIVSDVTRTFTSFTQAGIENALSRIYLGVHWRMDCEQGFACGMEVGHYVFDNSLQLRCKADFSGNGRLNSEDLYDFTEAYFNDGEGADYNGDGVVNSTDFSDYVRDYTDGCPS